MGQREEIMKDLEGIARRWRERVDEIREYEIVEEEEGTERGFIPSSVSYAEYREAQRLKRELLRKYDGKKLEDVIDGEELRTERGICYHIFDRRDINPRRIDLERMRRRILSDLKLIPGIWEITELALKGRGYETIEDLAFHPRFGEEAKRLLRLIENLDIRDLVDWIVRRYPKSHPMALYTSAFYDVEDLIFLDIETMGLFTRPIVLFGIARISEGRIYIYQYLLRNISEEPAALISGLSHLSEKVALVTYNGKAFDIPYIQERAAFYRIKADLRNPNFDMLHFARRAWGEILPSCKLAALERYLLGMVREEDVPGALVPEFYEAYMRTKNPGPLIPIVRHNKQDLITLANIFFMLRERWG